MALKRMQNDDAAQVGIGTMIVFIATILVAAVAAGVLIDTSQKLQAKSTQTGDAATQDVGTSLSVLSVTGNRTGTTGELEQLTLLVTLSPGADPLDVDSLVLQYNDGSSLFVAQAANFTASFLRDADGSGSDDVMSAGDLVSITLDLVPEGLELGNNVKVSINLVPPMAHQVTVAFTTPATFGTDQEVALF